MGIHVIYISYDTVVHSIAHNVDNLILYIKEVYQK